MDRMEAIREYCIEKAVEILRANPKPWISSTKDVVETAKELEKYITK